MNTPAHIARILDLLQNVKPHGTDKWQTCCPAHEDRKGSLSISIGVKGQALIKCFAGCETLAVLHRIGLEYHDLYAQQSQGASRKTTGKTIVATYDYTDAGGRLLFQTVRFDPKDFQQRRPDGLGGYIWNLKGVELELYHLPEILAARDRGETVYVVEGERDVENLRRWGLTATCNAQGAGKWRERYTEALRGADLLLLPDNDGPGRDHRDLVGSRTIADASSIRVLDLPDLPEKGDFSDWQAAGGTKEEFLRLVAVAPAWIPPPAEMTMEAWLNEGKRQAREYDLHEIGKRLEAGRWYRQGVKGLPVNTQARRDLAAQAWGKNRVHQLREWSWVSQALDEISDGLFCSYEQNSVQWSFLKVVAAIGDPTIRKQQLERLPEKGLIVEKFRDELAAAGFLPKSTRPPKGWKAVAQSGLSARYADEILRRQAVEGGVRVRKRLEAALEMDHNTYMDDTPDYVLSEQLRERLDRADRLEAENRRLKQENEILRQQAEENEEIVCELVKQVNSLRADLDAVKATSDGLRSLRQATEQAAPSQLHVPPDLRPDQPVEAVVMQRPPPDPPDENAPIKEAIREALSHGGLTPATQIVGSIKQSFRKSEIEIVNIIADLRAAGLLRSVENDRGQGCYQWIGARQAVTSG